MVTSTSCPSFQSLFATSTSGFPAGRSPDSWKWRDMAPSMLSCMASPRSLGPNCRLSSASGTLPLRKPFIWTVGCASASFSCTLASSSAAGTVIL